MDPETSINTHAYIASRLLAMRFLDICKGLDNNIEVKSKDEDEDGIKDKNGTRKLKPVKLPESAVTLYKVFFILHLNFWYDNIVFG